MRIIVKILLSFLMLIIGVVLNAVVTESGNSNTGGIRLIPAAVMIIGIIAIWKYKPNKENPNKDLDKTL
jgi:uncharacterized BrkB/YihY/UPF0761 family membrane protein